jgi:fumarate hydratase class II
MAFYCDCLYTLIQMVAKLVEAYRMSYSSRKEKDAMGAVDLPVDALYGIQTQRAINNFAFSGLTMPRAMIYAMGSIKQAAAEANRELGLLSPTMADAIAKAAAEVADGTHDRHFPVDIFQTGSGTSSHMNANEVIATVAEKRLGTWYQGHRWLYREPGAYRRNVGAEPHVGYCAQSGNRL